MEENDRIDTDMRKEAIDLIREAIEREKSSLAFYNSLLNQVNDEEDITIITEIMDDETRNNDILREVFFGITNTHIDEIRSIYVESRNNIDDYTENLKNGLFDELNSVKRYRKILSSMPDSKKYDMMMEVLTNKICHVNMYNYLITKNIHK